MGYTIPLHLCSSRTHSKHRWCYDQREFEIPSSLHECTVPIQTIPDYRRRLRQARARARLYQFAYNAMVGILHTKKIMIAADVGQFYATEFKNAPAQLNAELKRLGDVMQWRAAIHYFPFGNTGLLSLLYNTNFKSNLRQPRRRAHQRASTRSAVPILIPRFPLLSRQTTKVSQSGVE